jgi:hypothetical protein
MRTKGAKVERGEVEVVIVLEVVVGDRGDERGIKVGFVHFIGN